MYRNGTLEIQDTVNPSYSGTYSLSFTGTSGSDTVVVTLNEQEYMYLSFDYDKPGRNRDQHHPLHPLRLWG